MTEIRDTQWDLIVVGSGFASMFFVHRYLQHAGASARVLIVERGARRQRSDFAETRGGVSAIERESIINRSRHKDWHFTIGLGGSSNCWYACTPRMLPSDFALQSLYGIGVDWPVRYDDLEEYYCDAEELMAVAGPSEDTPFPRSRPYPQAAHRFTVPDEHFKAHFPHAFFSHPCARPTRPTRGRTLCCNNGVCGFCPVDAKFTILNGLSSVIGDPRVQLVTNAEVLQLSLRAGHVEGVVVRDGEGARTTYMGDLVALGANAIFNAAILLRSDVSTELAGRGLGEQQGVFTMVDLDGVDNFQGSTIITGHGYMHYDGAHRSHRSAALMETWNRVELRNERGKWRHRLRLKFIFEELPERSNRVRLNPDDPEGPPLVEHGGPSAYAQAGIDALPAMLEEVLEALPVEGYVLRRPAATESHLMGTTPMGADPASSVVDPDLVHHQHRNLLVLGSGAFPTFAPANPTLTLCALSLRAADRLLA